MTITKELPVLSEDAFEKKMEDFTKDLASLINKHSLENLCDMPDFMMAEMIADCLVLVASKIRTRDKWLGVNQRVPVG